MLANQVYSCVDLKMKKMMFQRISEGKPSVAESARFDLLRVQDAQFETQEIQILVASVSHSPIPSEPKADYLNTTKALTGFSHNQEAVHKKRFKVEHASEVKIQLALEADISVDSILKPTNLDSDTLELLQENLESSFFQESSVSVTSLEPHHQVGFDANLVKRHIEFNPNIKNPNNELNLSDLKRRELHNSSIFLGGNEDFSHFAVDESFEEFDSAIVSANTTELPKIMSKGYESYISDELTLRQPSIEPKHHKEFMDFYSGVQVIGTQASVKKVISPVSTEYDLVPSELANNDRGTAKIKAPLGVSMEVDLVQSQKTNSRKAEIAQPQVDSDSQGDSDQGVSVETRSFPDGVLTRLPYVGKSFGSANFDRISLSVPSSHDTGMQDRFSTSDEQAAVSVKVGASESELDIVVNAKTKESLDLLSRHQGDLRDSLKRSGVDEYSLSFQLDGKESYAGTRDNRRTADPEIETEVIELSEDRESDSLSTTGVDRRV